MSSNKVTITYTSDEHDCETCGSSFAESYILECDGKTYGGAARVNCFDSTEYTVDQVLCMFLEDIGYEVYWTSEQIEDDFKEWDNNGHI